MSCWLCVMLLQLRDTESMHRPEQRRPLGCGVLYIWSQHGCNSRRPGANEMLVRDTLSREALAVYHAGNALAAGWVVVTM